MHSEIAIHYTLRKASMPTPAELSAQIKDLAQRRGFALVGICPAVTPAGLHHFNEWLAAGHAGEMHYLEARREAYAHPRHVLDGARSLVMLGMHYSRQPRATARPGQGSVARYARGEDYHDLIHQRLKQLIAEISPQMHAGKLRGVVDTAPLLEREFAELAGLGWAGKNTMLINKHAGSYFFLAAMLTDAELAYDPPHVADHCGTCRACLDACPTEAILAPHVLDAQRCISYLTIELRGPIPRELRSDMGDWLFGCDICQEVCPWNRKAPGTAEASLETLCDEQGLPLLELFFMSEEVFRRRFRHTPLWRPRRRGILRNAAIVLGNQQDRTAIPALLLGIQDPEPLVRGAVAWALGRFDCDEARTALQARLAVEEDPEVREEIEIALLMDA